MPHGSRAGQIAYDAEIHDDGMFGPGNWEIEIGRFDVAMDHSDRMKPGERARIARERRHHDLWIKFTAPVLFQDVLQRLTRHAFKIVHHKEGAAVLRLEVVDEAREARAGNTAQRLCLAPESVNAGFAQFVQQVLDGHTATRSAVHRAKHLAEPAVADVAQKPPRMPRMRQFAVADAAKRLAEGREVGDALRPVGRKRPFKQISCAGQQLLHARTNRQRVRRRPHLEPALEKGNVRLRARVGLPTIRRPSRQHLVQAHAHAENVRADVSPKRRIGEIGRHVVEGADHIAAADRCRAIHPVRDLEIDELGRAIRAHDDVRRLDVAVNDAPAGSVGEAVDHSKGNAHRFVRAQAARRFGKQLLQRAPLDILDHDHVHVVERPLLAEAAVVFHDVRMLKRDKLGRTPLQPGVRLAVVILNGHHLQGDYISDGDRRKLGNLTDGLIDGSLASRAGLQVLEDPESANDLSGFVRRHQSLRPSLTGVPVTRVV